MFELVVISDASSGSARSGGLILFLSLNVVKKSGVVIH